MKVSKTERKGKQTIKRGRKKIISFKMTPFVDSRKIVEIIRNQHAHLKIQTKNCPAFF